MTVALTYHLAPDDAAAALRADALAGLTATPKTLPPRWFYDERGSELFDEITRLPEYYPTRAERAILDARAERDRRGVGRRHARRARQRDVGEDPAAADRAADGGDAAPVRALRRRPLGAAGRPGAAITAEYPGVDVDAVVGDFTRHLGELPTTGGRRLVAFLGSTIGNLEPGPRAEFLAERGRHPAPRATRSCWAPTWSRTPAGWCAPTTTPRA